MIARLAIIGGWMCVVCYALGALLWLAAAAIGFWMLCVAAKGVLH